MGNVDTVPTRPGAANGGSDKWANFLKVFSGETLSLFESKTIMRPLVDVRTIETGKSASFVRHGSLAAKFHKPGENILESGNGYINEMKFAEKVLNIDGQLIAPAFVSDIDDLLNHFDHRSKVSQEVARQLAYFYDRACIHTFIAAARVSSADVTYKTSGGLDLVGKQLATGSGTFQVGDLITQAYAAAVELDNKDIPEDGRVMFLNPTRYWALVNSGNAAVQSADYSPGNSNVAQGKLYYLAGFRLVKAPFMPSVNMVADDVGGTAGTQLAADYQTLGGNQGTGANPTMPNYSIKNDPFGTGFGYAGDFSKTLAVCGLASAVGVVQKHDVVVETERKIEYQGSLILGKLMTGFGILRPECAVEIKLT